MLYPRVPEKYRVNETSATSAGFHGIPESVIVTGAQCLTVVAAAPRALAEFCDRGAAARGPSFCT